MRTKLFGWTFLSLMYFNVLGQAKPGAPVHPKAQDADVARSVASFPDEPVVIEHLDSVYKMSSDGTGSKDTTVVARVQSEASVRQLGVLNISYASNSQHITIAYARVRKPDGTVIETPVSEAMDIPSPITQAAPFYSDLKQMQLPIKNLRVGDTLEWKSTLVWTKAEAPGNFWGQESFVDDGIALSQSLELRVPKDMYVNVWSPANKPEQTVVAGERVYRWVSSQTKPSVGKEADAAKELKKRQVWTAEQEVDGKEGKLPAVAWTTFKSWESVGAWYRGVEGDRIVPDKEVKAKVVELTAGKRTEEEKVRAVYGYVATQIRYVGVAFGIGRYQPHRAEDVLQNQYGDCKDKHTLLAALLAALGLHPDAVLIGAGVRFNEAVPSPGAFNHLITTVDVGKQQIWLDSTTEVAPYRMLSYVIRDKQALVIPETGVAKVARTPAELPFTPFFTMDASGSIDKEGTSNSRLVLMLRGDDELVVRNAFRQTSPAQYDQLVQQISTGMGYSGTASHAEIGRLEDTAEPLKLSYDYKREKAGDWDNYKTVPQVAPVLLPRIDEKEPPVQAITLGVPRVETSTATMKLPDGWGVELPEAVHAKSAYATYDETYKFEKGTLYTQRRVEVLREEVPVSDWKSYKKWTDAADLGNDRYVQLITNEKKESSASAAESGSSSTNSNEAQRLVASAYKAVLQRDFDDAQKMLDQAKGLNAQQEWLWTTYGFLDYSKGAISAAIKDYQKELSLHPQRYETYSALAAAQRAIGKRDEAEGTLRRWVNANGSDDQPSLTLSQMLLEDGRPKEATATAEAAIAKLPADKKNDERLQLMLGRSQVQAGEKKQGSATLTALLKTTENPEVMNDAAYELADAGLELPLAEETTRTALGRMTEESKTWTMDESPQVLAQKSQMIAATWDTMGWILYREGKLVAAESYLKAAWLDQPSFDIGEHLGEVQLAEGHKVAALTSYELAAATIYPYDAMGVKKAPAIKEKELDAKMDALRKDGLKAGTQDAPKTLQNLRKISIGPAVGVDGDAEYRMLLDQGAVVKAQATGSKELKGGGELLKKAKLNQLWPAGEQANLVRVGFLNCHSGVCELILE